MNVLLAAAELTPFVRTGALADSLVELSAGLQKAGHNVSVVLPYYRVIREDKSLKTKRSKIRFMVDVGPDQLSCEIREAQPLNGVRVFLVERDEFFDRSGIYGVEGRDYQDNAARFIFFTKCVVELAARMENPPEILHLNSWESALASALVRSRNLPLRTVLTPHSLEYQGNFWSYDFGLTNLPDDWFSAQGVEYFGSMNCLKAGLMFSDAVVFSSERMVGTVQTTEHGCGLDNVLREQRAKLVGIPTAVGLEGWLSEGGSFVDQAAGRAKNRALLEKTLGLDDGGPLLVCVSEATEGRGLDILLAAMDRILAAGMRLILLGPTGDPDHLIALEVAIRKHRRRL